MRESEEGGKINRQKTTFFLCSSLIPLSLTFALDLYETKTQHQLDNDNKVKMASDEKPQRESTTSHYKNKKHNNNRQQKKKT